MKRWQTLLLIPPNPSPFPARAEGTDSRFAGTTGWIPGCAEDDGELAVRLLYSGGTFTSEYEISFLLQPSLHRG